MQISAKIQILFKIATESRTTCRSGAQSREIAAEERVYGRCRKDLRASFERVLFGICQEKHVRKSRAMGPERRPTGIAVRAGA